MPSTLITGANRGLGLEFARQYLADGWQVYAACRNPASASELRRLADDSDNRLRMLAMDVTDPASIQAAAAELDGQAIDLLLNNAGIIGPRGQTIGNIDYEAWAEVLAVNTMGPMRVSEAFVEHVARSDRKLIVTLTSGMGSIGDNTSGGSVVYRSSKAAVNMVTRSLAVDLAPPRHHLRRGQSRLGTDGHGRPERQVRGRRKRERLEASYRNPWTGAVRQVLQSHGPRISLVACFRCPEGRHQRA